MLILPSHRGQKAELNYVAGYIPRWFTHPQMVTQPGLIRYDTIAEFNMDSKAEYSALSSTRSQKKN